MPVQLKTLLPLFILFILAFLIIRHFLVPDSFGQNGHYRAESLEENADHPIFYAGKAVCIECHDDIAALLDSDAHSGLSCEVCHGPGALHADDFEIKLEKPGTREFCGSCHQIHPARRIEVINQVDIKEHHLERKNCIDCHNPHAVWDLKE
ncbi:MAG: NapC/NirT family cytochrome c [Bacteroidales bacterium]|nr:NapC/NirT family cytochrome c [Bacteroidales bacterium]